MARLREVFDSSGDLVEIVVPAVNGHFGATFTAPPSGRIRVRLTAVEGD
jgi:hypothetical protein